jgi:hypothetical protein
MKAISKNNRTAKKKKREKRKEKKERKKSTTYPQSKVRLLVHNLPRQEVTRPVQLVEGVAQRFRLRVNQNRIVK